jgi:pimeloyl-ACP methyl ester carboxylesterase
MISLDLPGHGLTGPIPSDDYSQEAMAAFVDEFTTVMNIERFALVGHSMGGAVAARIALRHPERLTALILVSAAGLPTSTPRRQSLGYFVLRTPVLQNVLLYVSPRMLFEAEFKRSVVNPQLATPEMIDRYWILNRKVGNRAATLKRSQTPYDTFLPENVSKIVSPTLLIWGDQDGVTPPDIAQSYNAAIKGSRLVMFRNTGHLAMEETPAQSARVVREFLAPQSTGSLPSQ